MYSKNSKFNKRVGTRAQVMHGNAKMTGGGLMKKDLKYNKSGKIVSKKLSRIATKEQRLQKAGYKTQKGVFELFQKQRGGYKKGEEIQYSTYHPNGMKIWEPGRYVRPGEKSNEHIVLGVDGSIWIVKNIKSKSVSANLSNNEQMRLALALSSSVAMAPGGSAASVLERGRILGEYKLLHKNQRITDLKYIPNRTFTFKLDSMHDSTVVFGSNYPFDLNGSTLEINDTKTSLTELYPESNWEPTYTIIDILNKLISKKYDYINELSPGGAAAASPPAAPGGSAAAMAIPNLNELITRASLFKKSIKSYSNNKKERAINTLANDIKNLYFKNIDIDIDTIKTALVSHKYNIENVIANLVITKINTARQKFNLTERQYTNNNKKRIIKKIKDNTPIDEIIGSYLDFST